MGGDRRHRATGTGRAIVNGARVGAGLGAVLVPTLALFAGAVAGDPAGAAAVTAISRLVDGVAAGAAVGAVAAALRLPRHGGHDPQPAAAVVWESPIPLPHERPYGRRQVGDVRPPGRNPTCAGRARPTTEHQP